MRFVVRPALTFTWDLHLRLSHVVPIEVNTRLISLARHLSNR